MPRSPAHAVAISTVSAILAFAPSAGASESDVDTVEGTGVAEVRQLSIDPVSNAAPGAPMSARWTWPEGRVLVVAGSRALNSTSYASSIHGFDLDTGEAVGSLDLPRALPAGTHVESADIDRAAGVAYLPQGNPLTETAVGSGNRSNVGTGNTCVAISAHECFGGVVGVSLRTFEMVSTIPYRTLSIDSALPTGVALRAMRHVAEPGGPGKLLLLLAEAGVPDVANDSTPSPRRQFNAGIHHVAQLDIAGAKIDWAVRVEACRSSRVLSSNSDAVRGTPFIGSVMMTEHDGRRAVVVGCHVGNAAQVVFGRIPLDAGGTPAALPVKVGLEGASRGEEPSAPAHATPPDMQQQQYFGPESAYQLIGDAAGGLVLAKVLDKGAEVWWVFDAIRWQLRGTIGVGTIGLASSTKYGVQAIRYSMAGLDPDRGRLYILARSSSSVGFAGGLFVVDVRRDPLPQALVFPELAAKFPGDAWYSLLTDAGPQGEGPFGVMVPREAGGPGNPAVSYSVLHDHVPFAGAEAEESEPYAGRTLDLEEIDGVTAVALDGAARGYGARVLMVGGADAATRAGPLDAPGNVWQLEDSDLTHPEGVVGQYPARVYPYREKPLRSPCTASDHELVLGFVGPRGPAVVDAAGSRGSAEPVLVDTGLVANLEAPTSRCVSFDWQTVWTTALFGRPPAEEPGVGWAILGTESVNCVSNDEKTTERKTGTPTDAFMAAVECEGSEASGFSYVRGTTVADVRIGEALSSFRIYRDPGRGIVSRVESVTRGISIPGLLRIDTVRGVAESWANGRRFTPSQLEEGQSYDPNCDYSRTAGTCLRRHAFGVWTPGYSCGPCGDEVAFADRLDRGLGTYGSVRFRQPDPALARGADNGFTAAISKPLSERFADAVLNTDLLQTVVPTLEIIRYAPPNRPLTGGGSRGRQILQFAGVEVSSSYSIQCLLVYDEATNTCAEAAEPPGSITVSLADADGKPLAGGAFEVRADVDADGVLGLKDTLLPNGACVTTDDGVGTCSFENLQPGSYLVSQVAAPPGYGRSAEPFVVELASGEARTVAFTNVSNLSSIELKVSDEAGSPLAGAVFAAYPDSDADGKVAPDAKPVAECTTDAQGVCSMQVPAGSYVLVQTSAPAGLEGIEPVPFTFASGGQVAAVTVVNYPPESPQAPDAPAAPIYTPPVDVAPPAEFVDEGYTPPSDSGVIVPETAPGPSLGEQVGGTVVQVVRAPGDALRLLSRDPKQAVAWTAALALFCLAALAVRRRQQALELMEG